MYIPSVMQAGPYGHVAGIDYDSTEGAIGELGGNVSMIAKLYNPPVFDKNPEASGSGQAWGRLIAYDPINHETKWEVKQVSHYNGGLLSTSTGLLMQGDAEGKFIVRDI